MASADSARPVHERMQDAIRDLKSLLDQRVTTAEAVREHHSHGESYHPAALPDAVCFPHTTDEVSEIMKISAKHQVPVIPFGAGTSLEGHVNAIHGGITIDMREMNKVVRISAEDLQATVEAGVSRMQLQQGAGQHRLHILRRSRAPTRRSAEWPRRAPPARRRSATARCART